MRISDEALEKEVVAHNEHVTKYIIKEPVGTVLILTSFDFPVLSTINHLVPAILCGNSVLIKDNPRSPLIGRHFEEACKATKVALDFFAE